MYTATTSAPQNDLELFDQFLDVPIIEKIAAARNKVAVNRQEKLDLSQMP